MAFSVGDYVGPAQSVFHSERISGRWNGYVCFACYGGGPGWKHSPGIVGRVTQSAGDNIRAGMGVGLLFPVILLIVLLFLQGKK